MQRPRSRGGTVFGSTEEVSAVKGSEKAVWSAELDELLTRLGRQERPYLEFFRTAGFSAGLYRLLGGAEDRQKPHREDELYWVLEGKAQFEAEGKRRPVQSGTVLSVPASVPHRFVDIEKDLLVLVLFAPPESET